MASQQSFPASSFDLSKLGYSSDKASAGKDLVIAFLLVTGVVLVAVGVLVVVETAVRLAVKCCEAL